MCAAGHGSVRTGSPRARLLRADAALQALPLIRVLGFGGEGPEETHHLRGGEAERLMEETDRERQRRESGRSDLYCRAQPLRLWVREVAATARGSPVPARRCPRLPHPHPKEAEGLLTPGPHRAGTPSSHIPSCAGQGRGSWRSALPAGGAPGPRACVRTSGRGVQAVSRVPLGGAGAQGPVPAAPAPQPPPWLSPGRGQQPGYLAGGSGSAGLCRARRAARTRRDSAAAAAQRPAEAAPLYIEAPGACPVPGAGRRGAKWPGPTVLQPGDPAKPPPPILNLGSRGWAGPTLPEARRRGGARERQTETSRGTDRRPSETVSRTVGQVLTDSDRQKGSQTKGPR